MNEPLYELMRLGIALAGAFIAMVWAALVLWVYRDSQSRSEGFLPTLLATSLVGSTFVVGWAIYMMLRPRQTLMEAYRGELQHREALLASTSGELCPACSTRVMPDFRLCPNCGTEVKQPCDVCKRPVRSSWNLCPYCGHVRSRSAAPVEEA